MNRCLLLLCFFVAHGCGLFAQSRSLARLCGVADVAGRFTGLELQLIRQGMVNAKKYVPDAILDVRYATTNNFLGVNVYGSYNLCYLQPDVALKLQRADSILKVTRPGWKFVLYDCARPVSVQQKMWDALKMPAAEKGKYVSNPKNLSVHNLGAAIDLGLADDKNAYVDMGTEFDYFGELAYPFMEGQLVRAGKLTEAQVQNRQVLRTAMRGAGFSGIPYEWWHFNSQSRHLARTRYGRVD